MTVLHLLGSKCSSSDKITHSYTNKKAFTYQKEIRSQEASYLLCKVLDGVSITLISGLLEADSEDIKLLRCALLFEDALHAHSLCITHIPASDKNFDFIGLMDGALALYGSRRLLARRTIGALWTWAGGLPVHFFSF